MRVNALIAAGPLPRCAVVCRTIHGERAEGARGNSEAEEAGICKGRQSGAGRGERWGGRRIDVVALLPRWRDEGEAQNRNGKRCKQ